MYSTMLTSLRWEYSTQEDVRKERTVDKKEIEALMEQLCDSYCRYTSAASGKTQDEPLDICEGCPLSRLGDLIGV